MADGRDDGDDDDDDFNIDRLAASDRETWKRLADLVRSSDACSPKLVHAMLAITEPDEWADRCRRSYAGLSEHAFRLAGSSPRNLESFHCETRYSASVRSPVLDDSESELESRTQLRWIEAVRRAEVPTPTPLQGARMGLRELRMRLRDDGQDQT